MTMAIPIPTGSKHSQDAITLNAFIGRSQLKCLFSFLRRGEERDYYRDLVRGMIETIDNMPKVYQQDGLGDKAVAHLHYFGGSADFWITEKDVGTEDQEQHQAFGLCDLGYGAELGYVSIREIIDNGMELDLNWHPKTIEEIKRGRD